MKTVLERFFSRWRAVPQRDETPAPLPAPMFRDVPTGSPIRARLEDYLPVLEARALVHDRAVLAAKAVNRPVDMALNSTLAEKTRTVITELRDILRQP